MSIAGNRRIRVAILCAAAALAGAGPVAAQQDCAAVEETDFEAVVGCMSLEQLAGQLSAFNNAIGQRLTGNTLEENVRAGLGTAWG